MNLYLKFENNDWYDFGADDFSSVFPITKKAVRRPKETKIKKWMNKAFETVKGF